MTGAQPSPPVRLRDILASQSGGWAPGAIIAARYRLKRIVGIDGRTAVWEALDTVTEGSVALKRPRPGSANGLALLQREAAILPRLKDPRIVAVYAFLPDIPCLVVEYVSGGSLADCLRRTGRIPSAAVREIGIAMCAALACAHRAAILHLDITPWSILLGPGGWKLSGFGNSSEAKWCRFCRGGDPRVFVCQAAPEQLAGEPATPETDLYQLAVTLYQALEGRCPPKGDSHVAPEFTDADVALRLAIASALQRQYNDAEAFARALRGAVPL